MWKKYLVLFLSKDWYTMYTGHAIVKARTENEAINKAAKKLNIKQAELESIKSLENRYSYCWAETEEV